MAHFPPCSLAAGSPVWAYLRDSGGETQDLASQRKYLMDYCKHHKLVLLRLFEDAATPGSSTVKRDQFEIMIQCAREGNRQHVDAIIYWDMKRFARNQTDSMFFEADLERRGYKLISLSDDIPDTPFAPVIKSFLRWKAEQDLKDISKDSRRGLRLIIEARDEQGNYLGIFPGRPPTCFTAEKVDLGLIRNNGTPRVVQRIVPDPALWPLGQLAWTMRAERASYAEIQDACKLYNSPTFGSCYAAFFRNRIYLGELEYGGRVYPAFVPALTDPDTFQKVASQQHQRAATQKSFKAGKGSYLLSGLCQCDYCKSTMHGGQNTRSGRSKFWRFYLCNQKKLNRASCESKQSSADKLEQAVVEIVCSGLLVPGYVAQLVESINHLLNDVDTIKTQVESKRQEVSKLKQAINRLLDALENGSSVAGRLTQRENELKKAERELTQLQGQLTQSTLKVDKSVIEAILGDMQDTLTGDEFKLKQKTLQKLVHKVLVRRDDFVLHCSLPYNLFMTRVSFMPPTGSQLNPCQIFTSTY